MGTVEKIFTKLSIPMPRPRIRLPLELRPEFSLPRGEISPMQAAIALAALAGKFWHSDAEAVKWARRKKIMPPDLGDCLTWAQACHMLWRFAWASRVNIALPGTGRMFDLPGWEALARWNLPGVQWCLSAGLYPGESLAAPADGEAFSRVMARFAQALDLARQPAEVSWKLQLFGDSMTDDRWGDRTTWVSLFPDRIGPAGRILVNHAYGGGVLTAMPGKKNSVIKLMPQLLHPDDDAIVVFAGTNDFAAGTLGPGEPGNADPQTHWGAVAAISRMAGEIPLLFVASPPRFNYGDRAMECNENGERINSRGWALSQGARATAEAAASCARPCLDLFHTPVYTLRELDFSTADGLHPNLVGDILIASRIYQSLTGILKLPEKQEKR